MSNLESNKIVISERRKFLSLMAQSVGLSALGGMVWTGYLEEAKSLGDYLVIGVNSDASIQGLKGSNRPIVPQDERLIVLAGLQAVDYLVVFEEDTFFQMLKYLLAHLIQHEYLL